MHTHLRSYFGDFFHLQLNLLLQELEQQHHIIAEKCVIKGSVVPLCANLMKGSRKQLNDLDVTLHLRDPLSPIDPNTILRIHETILKFLPQKMQKAAPLVRPDLGIINWHLNNPSANCKSPIDLSIVFTRATSPDASSSRDGFEIIVNYDKNRDVTFTFSQSAFVSQFISLENAYALFAKKQFTIPYELAEEVKGGLLIYLRLVLQGWTYVVADADGVYTPGDIEHLFAICFRSFAKVHVHNLDTMKLSRVLTTQINKHLHKDVALIHSFLNQLIALTIHYATESIANYDIGEKIYQNITCCILNLAPTLMEAVPPFPKRALPVSLTHYLEQVPHLIHVPVHIKISWLTKLLPQTVKQQLDSPAQHLLETHVDTLLTDEEITLATLFIAFINQFASLNDPARPSKSTELLVTHVTRLLSQKIGKKGTSLKKIDTLYRPPAQTDPALYLESICAAYHPSRLTPKKAQLILNWIQRDAHTLTLPLLQYAQACLHHVPEELPLFQKHTASKKMEPTVALLWNEMFALPTTPSPMPPALPPVQPEAVPLGIIERPSFSPIFRASMAAIDQRIEDAEYIEALHLVKTLKEELVQWELTPTALKKYKKQLSQKHTSLRDLFKAQLTQKQETLSPSDAIAYFERYPDNDLDADNHVQISLLYAINGQLPHVFLHLVTAHSLLLRSNQDPTKLEIYSKGIPILLSFLQLAIQKTPTWSDPLKHTILQMTQDLTAKNLASIRGKRRQYDFDGSLTALKTALQSENLPDPDHTILPPLALAYQYLSFALPIDLLSTALKWCPHADLFTVLCHMALEISGRTPIIAAEKVLSVYEQIRLAHSITYFTGKHCHHMIGSFFLDRHTAMKDWLDLVHASLHFALAIHQNGPDVKTIRELYACCQPCIIALRTLDPPLAEELSNILNEAKTPKPDRLPHIERIIAFEQAFQTSPARQVDILFNLKQ